MATIQSWRLLRLLKRAQIDEHNNLAISDTDATVKTISRTGEVIATAHLEQYATSLRSVLHHLHGEGQIMVVTSEPLQIRVTHAGWHKGQVRTLKLIDFLVKSFLVPIIVAAATTLVTLIVTGYFSR